MVALSIKRLDGPKGSKAPPLLIAHGLLGQGKNFSTLARGFAEKREVIIVDMRNHGDSPWADQMTYPEMARDLADVIRREAEGKATVLGHSMGGKAAIALLEAEPNLVAGAIIADIAPIAYTHTHNSLIDAMLSIDFETHRTRRAVSDELALKVADASTRAFLLQNLRVGQGDARPSWKANLPVLRAAMSSLVGWEMPGTTTSFEEPVLSLRGETSEYVNEAGAKALANLFPQTVFEAIPHAGHWLHAEQPQAFHKHIDAFLNRQNL